MAEAPESDSGGSLRDDPAGPDGEAKAASARRRARVRQLGELKVPAAFSFSKSGSLRDSLRQSRQTFSSDSYVTPKFGAAPAAPAEHGGDERAGDKLQQQEHALLDPELVAQFERAMEQLSEDEGCVLDEFLEALERAMGPGRRTARRRWSSGGGGGGRFLGNCQPAGDVVCRL
ncbi:hypothetical protein C2845_PM05G01050 [Panicum miliaceum]|uniref:Uncharacterized protein n=1 Tax=Panicum miliaceum TaxID=4540 RepID=A0A3L6T064_PANMI|nr:hypothetical protein C2845_PM05G01050 [Panicum miliaceum]